MYFLHLRLNFKKSLNFLLTLNTPFGNEIVPIKIMTDFYRYQIINLKYCSEIFVSHVIC